MAEILSGNMILMKYMIYLCHVGDKLYFKIQNGRHRALHYYV